MFSFHKLYDNIVSRVRGFVRDIEISFPSSSAKFGQKP